MTDKDQGIRRGSMEFQGLIENQWIDRFDPDRVIIRGRNYYLLKRAFDLVIILLSSPFWLALMALISVVILITSGSPVLFVQQRTGMAGKRFKMFKFRTMVRNAQDLVKEYASVDVHGNLLAPLKLKNDPRITRIGRFLRKTSLDELPQVFNVLLGEMSLVGPRPTSWSPEAYKLWHTERLDVLPGITGLWQISDRGDEDFDEWLRWDIRYIERRSLWLDIAILVKTITRLFRQPGAR